jgi:hypothetical protein
LKTWYTPGIVLGAENTKMNETGHYHIENEKIDLQTNPQA